MAIGVGRRSVNHVARGPISPAPRGGRRPAFDLALAVSAPQEDLSKWGGAPSTDRSDAPVGRPRPPNGPAGARGVGAVVSWQAARGRRWGKIRSMSVACVMQSTIRIPRGRLPYQRSNRVATCRLSGRCTRTRARNSSGSTVSGPAVGRSALSERYVTRQQRPGVHRGATRRHGGRGTGTPRAAWTGPGGCPGPFLVRQAIQPKPVVEGVSPEGRCAQLAGPAHRSAAPRTGRRPRGPRSLTVGPQCGHHVQLAFAQRHLIHRGF
jgi:hypothetical protein